MLDVRIDAEHTSIFHFSPLPLQSKCNSFAELIHNLTCDCHEPESEMMLH